MSSSKRKELPQLIVGGIMLTLMLTGCSMGSSNTAENFIASQIKGDWTCNSSPSNDKYSLVELEFDDNEFSYDFVNMDNMKGSGDWEINGETVTITGENEAGDLTSDDATINFDAKSANDGERIPLNISGGSGYRNVIFRSLWVNDDNSFDISSETQREDEPFRDEVSSTVHKMQIHCVKD